MIPFVTMRSKPIIARVAGVHCPTVFAQACNFLLIDAL